MAKKGYSKEEKERIKRYHDTFKAKEKLHGLMKRIIYATGNGEESEDYTKTASVYIGENTIYFDPYYQRLTFYDKEDCEWDIREDDLESVKWLIKELEKRLDEFQNEIKKISIKEIFDKPIDGSFLEKLKESN